jgi:hypothetical protein
VRFPTSILLALFHFTEDEWLTPDSMARKTVSLSPSYIDGAALNQGTKDRSCKRGCKEKGGEKYDNCLVVHVGFKLRNGEMVL